MIQRNRPAGGAMYPCAMDPLAGSPWSQPEKVAGFARSGPNPRLVQYAGEELRRVGSGRVADIGCGAGRNAVPLAELGWDVVGTDLSWPMVEAATSRTGTPGSGGRLQFALAPMDALPLQDTSVDVVIAHG